MKNTLHDLNDHLFAAIERLSDENLDKDQVEREIKRSHAAAKLGQTIVSNANLQLRAQQLFDDGDVKSIPAQLTKK